MSGVTPPSEGGYAYYKQQIDALEDEIKLEKKRSQAKDDSRAARMEESRLEERRRSDEQLAKTISKVKDESTEVVQRERKNAQAEVDRMKAQQYDRFGRSNGLEADVLKAELDTQMHSSALEREHHTAQLAASDDHHRGLLKDIQEATNREAAANIQKYRDESVAGYEKINQDRRFELGEVKQAYQKRADEIALRAGDDIHVLKNEAERERSSMMEENAAKVARTELSAADKLNVMERAADEKMRVNAQSMTDSHTRETQLLREKAQALSIAQSDVAKARGQAIHDVTRDFETEWMNRQKGTATAYESEIEKLKHQAKEQDAYFGQLQNQTMKEKDAYFAGVISSQAGDNRKAQKELESTFDRSYSQLKNESERDSKQTAEAHSRKMDQANLQMNNALEKQAKTNQETSQRQRQNDETATKMLRREIAFKNSDDLSAASPALEAKIRDQVTEKYDTNLKAEASRNHDSETHMFETLSQRQRDTVLEKDRSNAAQQMHQEALRQFDKTQFLDHLGDLQHSTSETLKNKEQAHDRETGQMSRNYAQTLEKQRREFELSLEAARVDSSAKLNALRQESDFSSKMAQRAFALKQNELIRENEKKLADQKIHYEDLLEELRTQITHSQQDSEKRVRGALEEQARSYEQKIAQTEGQYKERERYTAQSYEDQLEKARRTNALLHQKKS